MSFTNHLTLVTSSRPPCGAICYPPPCPLQPKSWGSHFSSISPLSSYSADRHFLRPIPRPTVVFCIVAEDGESADPADPAAPPPLSATPPPPARKGFGSGVKKRSDKTALKGLQQKGVFLKNNAAGTTVPEEGSSTELHKLVDVIGKKSSAHSSIDPAKAKLGKVDFVRVQNWGSDGEDSPKLEDLQVKSFSPAATSNQTKSDGPFYEKLVNRLQLLESKGELSVAQAKPLPSFDRWQFGEDRYLQFLVDQRSVFEALRDAIGTIRKERCKTVAGVMEEVVPLGGAACAIALFNEDLGLDRCAALSADIASISNLSKGEWKTGPEALTVSTQAVGYARYIGQLGKTSLTDGEKAKECCLKLLAHVFAVYVSHLTTGMRIGAKAMDNVVSLGQTKAVTFYHVYPLKEKDPLKLFMATINLAGSYIISDDDEEQVMQELAKAFQRTSLLLSVLAVEGELSLAAN